MTISCVVLYVSDSLMMLRNKYIDGIDGLRAVAIIAVMLFHANAAWLPGGYLGVDIFFVISGFLITRIILTSLDAHQFRFGAFYASRIRRLLPALFTMILVVMCFSCLFLMPLELMRSSAAGLTNVIFLSNYYFARFYDYFSAGVNGQPLIHTWSLAVEIQFYLIWPLLVVAIYRKAHGQFFWLTIMTLIMLAGALCFSEYLINTGSNNFNYYSNFTRSAELLGGCLAGILTLNGSSMRSWCAVLGGIVIILSLLLVRNESQVPGLISLPLVIGTMLLISVQRSLVMNLLSVRVLDYIGKLSYSLYLWHWPFFSTFKYMAGIDELSFVQFIALMVPIAIISWLSYQYIETPIRKNKIDIKLSILKYYAFPAIMIIVIGLPLKMSDGELYRYGFGNEITASNFIDSQKYCAGTFRSNCRIGSATNKPSQNVLFGDSHAAQYMPFFDVVGRKQGVTLNAYSVNGCSPIFTRKEISTIDPKPSPEGSCEDLHLLLAQHLKEYDRIYIAAYWKNYLIRDKKEFIVNLRQTLAYLHQYGAQIILIQDTPAWKNNSIERYLRNESFKDKLKFSLPFENHFEVVDDSMRADQVMKSLAREFSYVTYLPIIDELNSAGLSLPIVNHILVYKDTSHLNNQGSNLLGDYYNKHVNKSLLLPSAKV